MVAGSQQIPKRLPNLSFANRPGMVFVEYFGIDIERYMDLIDPPPPLIT